jgi:hypothetical protein
LVYWWLSFATEKEFLGVCVVRAEQTFIHAIRESHAQGCNPGGHVRGYALREGLIPDPTFVNRLLNREEAEYLAETL